MYKAAGTCNAGAYAELRTRAIKKKKKKELEPLNMFIFRVSESSHIMKTKVYFTICWPKDMLPIFKHFNLMYKKYYNSNNEYKINKSYDPYK